MKNSEKNVCKRTCIVHHWKTQVIRGALFLLLLILSAPIESKTLSVLLFPRLGILFLVYYTVHVRSLM